MKGIKLLTILILLTFFYECKEHEVVFVGKSKYGLKFKQEYKFPSGNPLLEVFGGNSIHIIDTLLLVQRQHENPTYYWEVYSLNSMKHLKSILRHGRGPSEVLFAHYSGQHEKINNENWMLFFDTNSAKFLKINLDKSIQSGNDIIELITHIDPEKFPCFAIANDAFLYRDYNRNGGSVSLMKSDNSWENPLMIKEIYKNINFEDFHKLTHSQYYNKKNNKVCVIPYYVNHIQIIDLEGDGDMILSTANSNNWQAIRQQDFSESMVFYASTRITDDYIFALYTNKKISELGNVPDEVEIHVFTWDGDAVAKFRFKDYITSFAIDTKNKVLYGINNIEQIYAYDISSCLDFIQQ